MIKKIWTDLKRLILKLALALMLILLGAALIRHWVDPSPWYGNDILEEKMKVIAGLPDGINTIFIGSSIVLRNFNPVFFDSLIAKSLPLRTYNLGVGGTLPPETYRIYDWLLRNHPDQLQCILIELRDVGMFHPRNLHTLRMKHWITPGEYAFIARTNLQSTIEIGHKTNNLRYYGIACLERLFLINYFNDLYAPAETSGQDLFEDKRQQVRQRDLRGHIQATGTFMRREQFLMDTTHLSQMAEMYRTMMQHPDLLPNNHPHVRRISEMIRDAESRGIQIYFVLQPKQNEIQLEETLGLFCQIPEKNRINLADPDRFPELYHANLSTNDFHFNHEGTRRLTTLIAEHLTEVHSHGKLFTGER